MAKVKRETAYGEEVLEKSVRVADEIRRLRSYLDKIGVVYRPVGRLRPRDTEACKVCGATNVHYAEKGVDVGLAAEMVRDAVEGNAEKVVLVTSDTDLAPALSIVNEYCSTVYVGFEDFVVDFFRYTANETKVISNELVGMAYAEALAAK